MVIAIEKTKDVTGKEVVGWFVITSFYRGRSVATTLAERTRRMAEINSDEY